MKAQIFFAVIEDLLDLFADRESIIISYRYVACVEDRVNILPQ